MIGSGQGSVNSSPAGIACPGSCTASFSSATLYQNPDISSIFTGWGGACAGMEICTLTVPSDKAVDAVFSQKNVLRSVSGSYYGAVQSAYNTVSSGGKIQVTATDQPGDVVIDKPITVSLEGGYDAGFTTSSSVTKILGKLVVGNGHISVKNIALNSGVTQLPPGKPSGVKGIAGNGQITVTWDTVLGASSYNIYYATDSGVSRMNGNKINGASSGHTITGLSNGSIYFITVTAANANGEGVESQQVFVIPGSTAGTLSAPIGFYCNAGDKVVDLNWDSDTGATSYSVYWSTSPNLTTATGTKISPITGTSYKHSGLTNGATYYYLVTASNGIQESSPSSLVTAKPSPAPQHLIKVSRFGTIGQPMGSTAYEYDTAGNMVKESTLNFDGMVAGYTTFEYNQFGQETKRSIYNILGVLTEYVITEYNANQDILKESTYNNLFNPTQLTEYVLYEYDASGNNIKIATYNGFDDLLMFYTTYEYDNSGFLIKKSEYDFEDMLTGYTTYVNNAAGQETKQSVYDIAGNLTDYKISQYDNQGRIIWEETFNGWTDMSTGHDTFEYNGNELYPFRMKSFDFAGNLTWYIINVFNSHGQFLKSSSYDDSGLLNQYVVFEYGN